MKLIIQIPCYNEEETLKIVLNELPKKIEVYRYNRISSYK